MSINIGQDNDDGRFYDGYIDLAVADDFHFNIAAAREKLDTGGGATNQWSMGFGNISQYAFSWNLSYEWWGNSNVLVTRNTIIDLSYFKNNWDWIFGVEEGELEIFGLSSSRVIDHDAYRLGLGYSSESMYWELTYQLHDYGFDMERLNFPEVIFLFRPALLQIITPDSKQRATALAHDESVFRVGWLANKYTVEMYYQLIESSVTRETDKYIGLRFSKQLTSAVDLNIEVSHIQDGGPTSTSIGLIYSW